MQRRIFLGGMLPLALAQADLKLGRKVRVGVIGTLGHIAELTGPMPKLPELELVGLVEEDPDGKKNVARNALLRAAKPYANVAQLLDEAKPDLAVVCNSNGARAAAVLACAERKVPIFSEKPLALSRREFQAIQKVVIKNNVPIALMLPMRHEPYYAAMREMVRAGVVGEVGQITSQKSYKGGDRAGWYKNKPSYGSTTLWIGIHMFDLMRYVSGREFTEAFTYQGQVAAPPTIGQMENATTTVLKLDNGGAAVLHMDYYRPESAPTHGDDRLRIAGSKGVIEYMAATGLTLIEAGKPPRQITDLPPKRWLLEDFLATIYNGAPNPMPLSDVWMVNEITLAAEESARTNRPVKITRS